MTPHKILYIQYTNPAAYPPLEHSSHIFAWRDWQVMLLGVGGTGTGASNMPFLSNERISVRMLPLSLPGWRQKLHYLFFVGWGLCWALRLRPRWIYASDHLSAPLALLLSLFFRFAVIYHEHDSPRVAHPNLFQQLCLFARRRLARRAKLCILPNQSRLAVFKEETQATSELICVWNCPRAEEVQLPRAARISDTLLAYYHGNLSEKLLPLTVIQALAALAGKVKLRVIGYETSGQQGYSEKMRELARSLHIEDYVQFIQPAPRHQLWQHIRECDIGLVLINAQEDDLNLRHLTGASNKPFDYMAAGLALLTPDLPEWRGMYVENGYGLACNPNNVDSIANALKWFCDHPAEMRAMGERGRQQIISEWNYEQQFAPVLTLIG